MSEAHPQSANPAAAVPIQRASRTVADTAAPARAAARPPRSAARSHLAGSRATARDPRLPSRAIVAVALLSTLSIAALDRAWTGRLSQFFDLCFVLVCIIAALAVRRSGLFTVGVVPPLVLVTVLSVFATVDPMTLTAEHLDFMSTLLAGLAHHAAALVAGHASALTILVARGTVG